MDLKYICSLLLVNFIFCQGKTNEEKKLYFASDPNESASLSESASEEDNSELE